MTANPMADERRRQRFAAAAGLLLVLFLVAHLGALSLAPWAPGRFERWAAALHAAPWLPPLEWGLAALLALHPLLALGRWLTAGAAVGPVQPLRRSRRQDTALAVLAARSQGWSGALLLVFLVVHLAQLRWHRPAAGQELAALQAVLSQPASLLLYGLVGMAVALHLVQGVEAAHRSLGLLEPTTATLIRRWGRWAALLLGGGFSLLALALRLQEVMP
ncbi:MAG: succinate dehydrogenase [Synechococcaceae cyanobacterium]|nr:succinate dehydrogenase [Synechococcaceae cyanobacterium]